MIGSEDRILLLCYGNPGRLDDGLGAAFGCEIEERKIPGVTVNIDYQLAVEDAPLVAEHDAVLFVDAAVNGPEPFFFEEVDPELTVTFTSHSISPGSLLAMARDFFSGETTGYALGIRGYDFNEFGEYLSASAADNLKVAVAFLDPVLRSRSFAQAVRLMSRAVDNGGNYARR